MLVKDGEAVLALVFAGPEPGRFSTAPERAISFAADLVL